MRVHEQSETEDRRSPDDRVRDLRPTERGRELCDRMVEFMNDEVFPAEAEYHRFRENAGPSDHTVPPVVEELKRKARARGLWNLFLPAVSGIGQLDYAYIAEMSGWSLELAPEAINGQAPDTGNMELLHLFGSPEQKARWLDPLLAGEIRSAFAMTEPGVASSDATNIETRITREGDGYVVDGVKWWTSGAADSRCRFFIVMGKTDPAAERHRQQSMVVVPVDTPGVHIERSTTVFGRQDQHGHCIVRFNSVKVPATALLGGEGEGFTVAQARLGPGRIHHCMRALGAAERALQMMVDRASTRVAFGKTLSELGMTQAQLAESRIAIDQARFLCQHTARVIDLHGNRAAAPLVSECKVIVPRVATQVIDRAIQVHGAAGVSDDLPLAAMYGWHRAMRILDGPDEVHLRTVAKNELRRRRQLDPTPTTTTRRPA